MDPLREAAPPPPERPWWRRNLSNGLMVIYCLLLLVAAAAIFRNCSAYHEVVDCLERGDHWDNRTETCVPR